MAPREGCYFLAEATASKFSLARSFLSVFSVSERFAAVPGPLFYFSRRPPPTLEVAFKSSYLPIKGGGKSHSTETTPANMQLKHQESTGGVAPVTTDPESPPAGVAKPSPSLLLGQRIPLASISGPTYVSSQLLVQQTAYKLSDKIFSFSPETFDLDLAVKDWAQAEEKNIHGETTTVVPLQTRAGAGTFALGYIFSKDFDLSKRHIPQTLLAPSLSLRHLRAALDQLSLLYGVASPFVAHIAAADYSAQDGLVAEYESALQTAEELGLGLVSSSSAYEVQHMSLFATLMAALLPTIHIYDGLRTARETLRVVDALSEAGIAEIYKTVAKGLSALNKRLDTTGKVVELLRAFNNELGTAYSPFEYHGHEAPETVLVVFGSAESQIAKQVADTLAAEGKKVGTLNVRIYRPFIEEAFLEALPTSVQQIVVLGQVRDATAVEDASVQSALYSDVLTAVSFADRWTSEPTVSEVKYAASAAHTPSSIASIFHGATGKEGETETPFSLRALDRVEQYTFWDVDNSNAAGSPSVLGTVLARESTNNVYVHEVYDNLVHGGVVRTDIRSSKKSIEAPFDVEEAAIVFVGEEKLLNGIAILKGAKSGGTVILRAPGFKAEDAEKRIPAAARQEIQEKGLELFVLDSSFSPALEKDAQLLVQLAFLKIARPEITVEQLAKLTFITEDQATLAEYADALAQSLHKVDVPATWAELSADAAPKASLVQALKPNSFVPFQKEETEQDLKLNNWQSAAKGLVFKEAYGTQNDLRPDLTVKTHTITVKENRRLTPAAYDRNIFHIEFDLGDSGLTYNIGEALGIHADNDPKQVLGFIQSYGLNADDLVQVPSREDASISETRTVYQSLVRNLDILGKPPKRFFEALAEYATDEQEQKKLAFLGSKEGADAFKRLSEDDTATYVDVLEQFASARPAFHDLVKIVSPLKRREYSIASAQAVTPTSVALMIVVVDWVDSKGRTRYGQATRYLSQLAPGTAVTASVKPSVMKLPERDTAPLIMAGLGTGLAPFRAFVQYRAMQKAQGKEIGAILLYMGSRHQREEYLYGEEWEAYVDAGVITLLGAAFSRDQKEKIYIQDRMRQTIGDIVKAYVLDEGSFYLCGPTWPVPDVTAVLEEAIAAEAKESGRKVDPRKEIERLKEDGRETAATGGNQLNRQPGGGCPKQGKSGTTRRAGQNQPGQTEISKRLRPRPQVCRGATHRSNMNATVKRKFNALLQGIGSRPPAPPASPSDQPRPSSSSQLSRHDNDSLASPTSKRSTTTTITTSATAPDLDLLTKKRRVGTMPTSHSTTTTPIKYRAAPLDHTQSSPARGGPTTISNVTLRKWTPAGSPAPSSAEGEKKDNSRGVQLQPKYCPGDREQLLRRLATFQELTDWTPKPDRVSEVEWAKRGWVCQGKERVKCTLCSRELVVKLNRKVVDGKEISVLVASEIAQSVVDMYTDLIVSSHADDCLWRKKGCDDSLLRLPIPHPALALSGLRQRYDELCERKDFLPYEFNLRLPPTLDIDVVLSYLPPTFFTSPPPPINKALPQPPPPPPPPPNSNLEINRAALALAILGWQGLSNARIGGPVPNSASCHTCLRRLGLWMFKSKEVDPATHEVLVPAPMDHLDPLREHRFFCPWKNGGAQRNPGAKPLAKGEVDKAGWEILVQVLSNEAFVRQRTSGTGGWQDKCREWVEDAGEETAYGGGGPMGVGGGEQEGDDGVGEGEGGEEDEETRKKKDLDMKSRLRRVKSLFNTKAKGGSKLRKSMGGGGGGGSNSRPGTPHSTASKVD
ncbi:hypothetical protein B0T17DRAFT_505804 [Bombardia bombarda]|uniref:assimilatory sulfite reductase (NADPH) n=1 Tax=Bombardia bombarda TaxID=252184 RepID=A0AA39X8E7_9PEZI|nr:hypothetical protein B0T17DRAFT_505804 [Bombardia bombarda]